MEKYFYARINGVSNGTAGANNTFDATTPVLKDNFISLNVDPHIVYVYI